MKPQMLQIMRITIGTYFTVIVSNCTPDTT